MNKIILITIALFALVSCRKKETNCYFCTIEKATYKTKTIQMGSKKTEMTEICGGAGNQKTTEYILSKNSLTKVGDSTYMVHVTCDGNPHN